MASDDEAAHVARLIDRYHELFSAGDIEGVLDLWDDDGSVFEPSPTARGKSPRGSIGLSQDARTHLKEMAERERFELSMGQ